MTRKKWLVSLLVLLSLSLFLRLFSLQELFYFTHDEETVVWRVMPLLRDKDIFLLGGVTPMHVHLGPWFYYLSAAILAASKLNPLGWGIAGAVVGTGTTALMFFLGKKFYNLRVGFVAALLYAVSFITVAFDRHWWPLVLDPFLSLAVIFGLAQAAEKKWRSIPLLAAALALAFHTDPSTWGLLLLAPLVWLKFKLPIKQRAVILGLSILLLSFLPLITFDLKNQGTNILGIKQYFTETNANRGLSLERFTSILLYVPQTLGRLLYTGTTDLSHNFSYCPQYSQTRIEQTTGLLVLLTVAVIAFFFLRDKTRHKIDWIIGAYFIIVILGLNVYGNFFSSDIFDHYLATLLPLFLLMVAIALDYLYQNRSRLLAVALILLFVLVNLRSLAQISITFGFKDKQEAVAWTISELKDEPFALDSIGSCFRFNGVRYLFTLKSREPDLSFVDPNFFWLYQEFPKSESPDILVVFVMAEKPETNEVLQQYGQYQSSVISRKFFGNMEVLIVDNSAKNFAIDL